MDCRYNGASMNKVSWYIFRQLTTGMILMSVGLAGIIWLTQAVGRLDAIVNKASSAKTFIYFTLLLIPNFLTIVLPIALFTVVIFVYSRMNADRELVVLSAAGLSPYNIAKPALLLGVIVTGIAYALTLQLTPRSYQQFRNLQWDIRYNIVNVVLKEGVFNTISDNVTVYFRERSSDNELNGIFVHETRKDDEPVVYIADRGAVVQSPTGPRVLMFDGVVQQVDRADPAKTRTTSFDQYPLDIKRSDSKPTIRYREARERGTMELLTLQIESLGNPRDFGKFIVEGHQRITAPLTGLVFVLIGLVSLFYGDYSRRGQSRRVIVAVVLVVGMQLGNIGLANLIAKDVDLVPLLYANVGIPLIAGFLALVFLPRIRFGPRMPVAEPVS